MGVLDGRSAVESMFVTHFGSSLDGVTVWWERDSDSNPTWLTAYCYFRSYSNPYVINNGQITTDDTVTPIQRYATCNTHEAFELCVSDDDGLTYPAGTEESKDDVLEIGMYF